MNEKNCFILGIESSCDDTAAAVINNGVILSNKVATQKIHEEYGGVVPELASRAHQKNIIPVVQKAIADALAENGIDTSYSNLPSLMGHDAFLVDIERFGPAS